MKNAIRLGMDSEKVVKTKKERERESETQISKQKTPPFTSSATKWLKKEEWWESRERRHTKRKTPNMPALCSPNPELYSPEEPKVNDMKKKRKESGLVERERKERCRFPNTLSEVSRLFPELFSRLPCPKLLIVYPVCLLVRVPCLRARVVLHS
jgi:hypothetical protein